MPINQLRKQFLTLPLELKTIKYIGAEIEGGCGTSALPELEDMLAEIMPEGFSIGGDGSIRGYRYSYEVRFHDADIPVLIACAEKVFSILQQNRSCGNHFHLSFHDRSCAEEFFNIYPHIRLIELYTMIFGKRKKYMARFDSGWCDKINNVNDLMRNITGSRYYAINLQSLRRHGTIEFRIMPYARNVAEWIRQLAFVINFAEDIIMNADKYAEQYNEIEQSYTIYLEEYDKEVRKDVP